MQASLLQAFKLEKPERKRTLERPKRRWNDNTKMDLK
jgi:hypothetical protein